MKGVREYNEDFEMDLLDPGGDRWERAGQSGSDRIVIKAYNEAGHDCVEIDALDLIAWIKKNRPELIE